MLRTFLLSTVLFTSAMLISSVRPRGNPAVGPPFQEIIIEPPAPPAAPRGVPREGFRTVPVVRRAPTGTIALVVPREGRRIVLVVRRPEWESSPRSPYLGCGEPCLTPYAPRGPRGQ